MRNAKCAIFYLHNVADRKKYDIFFLDILKSAIYKFGGLGKKYISPIGAESALFFSPKRIFLRENSFLCLRRRHPRTRRWKTMNRISHCMGNRSKTLPQGGRLLIFYNLIA
jgi:hypothetical protein